MQEIIIKMTLKIQCVTHVFTVLQCHAAKQYFFTLFHSSFYSALVRLYFYYCIYCFVLLLFFVFPHLKMFSINSLGMNKVLFHLMDLQLVADYTANTHYRIEVTRYERA